MKLSKYTNGLIIITTSYFATLLIFANIAALIKPNENTTFLQNFVGGFLIVIPYIFVGIYSRKKFEHPTKFVLWLSLIAVLCERVLIFLIGTYYASQRLLPGWNGFTVLKFIQYKTPAFYFTTPYIILGSISVLISVGITSFKSSKGR